MIQKKPVTILQVEITKKKLVKMGKRGKLTCHGIRKYHVSYVIKLLLLKQKEMYTTITLTSMVTIITNQTLKIMSGVTRVIEIKNIILNNP